MNEIADTVRHFILERCLPGESPSNLTDTTPLRTSGILDSMATLALVDFIERRYGFELEAHETGIEHFDTIADVAALVERKRGNAV